MANDVKRNVLQDSPRAHASSRSWRVTADWHQEMTGAHADLSKDVRAAWAKLLCCLAALVVLAMALPGPGDLVSTVVDTVTGVGQGSDRAAAVGVRTPDAAAGFLNTAEHAVLLAAGLIVWVLLVWALAIVIIAGLGRLPGTGGRAARKALRRIAPAAAGRLVIAAVGVSAIAGAAGCATPDGTDAPVVSVANVVATSDAATTGDSTTPLLDIDWPDPAAASGSDTAAPATGSSPAGTASNGTPTAPTAAGSPLPAYDPAPPDSTAPAVGSPVADQSASAPAEPAPPDLPAPDTPAPDAPAPDTTAPDTTAPDTPGSTAATPRQADAAGADPSSPATTTDPDSPPSPAPTAAAPASAAETASPATGAAPGADGSDKEDESVTVRPGDTLWAIAARHLPSGATDAEIDTGWRAGYAANVGVIGANPDLILPGQHLLPGHSEMRP